MVDIALAYNPVLRCCDVVFNGTDFALDATPASAMLFSILTNGRARPDDIIPTSVTDWAAPASFTARGGCPCDALSSTGGAGGRMWLLQRRLANDATLQDALQYLAGCLGWLESVRGYALRIAAAYVAPDILGYQAQAGATTVALRAAL